MKFAPWIIFAVGAIGLLAQAAPAIASPATKVDRLERRVAKLERARDRWVDRARSAREERDVALAQRDSALAGLPDAIRAVPLDRFWDLVFVPARDTWPCDSYYQGDGGYWSLDFMFLGWCET